MECRVLEINGCYIPGQEKIGIINRLISGPIEIVVGRPNREETYLFQIQELSNKIESLTQEREALKGDNLRLKHRISYLEEVQRDENLLLANHDEHVSITRANSSSSKPTYKEDQYYQYEPSKNKPPVHRSEIRIQSVQSRQKPPRASKLKTDGSTNTLSGMQSDSEPDHIGNKRLHSSLDVGRSANEGIQSSSGLPSTLESVGKSSSRIKSSIVDKHFGHVIRVTHHHHPLGSPLLHNQQQYGNEANSVSDVHSVRSFDSFVDPQSFRPYQTAHSIDNGTTALTLPKANQRSAPSPTQVSRQ